MLLNCFWSIFGNLRLVQELPQTELAAGGCLTLRRSKAGKKRERELIRERTNAELAAARARDRLGGGANQNLRLNSQGCITHANWCRIN